MFVVILQNSQNLVQLCAGNKDHAFPVVDHPARPLSVVLSQAPHLHPALLQFRVSARSLQFGQLINP